MSIERARFYASLRRSNVRKQYGLPSESDPAHGGAAQPTTKRETAGGKPAA
jgi:hypothetical protein